MELPSGLNSVASAAIPSTVRLPSELVWMMMLTKSVGKSALPEGVANT
jgi:hypothetical protein